MIWFFLTGWVGGVIGTLLFLKWWLWRHTRVVRVDANDREFVDEMVHELHTREFRSETEINAFFDEMNKKIEEAKKKDD